MFGSVAASVLPALSPPSCNRVPSPVVVEGVWPGLARRCARDMPLPAASNRLHALGGLLPTAIAQDPKSFAQQGASCRVVVRCTGLEAYSPVVANRGVPWWLTYPPFQSHAMQGRAVQEVLAAVQHCPSSRGVRQHVLRRGAAGLIRAGPRSAARSDQPQRSSPAKPRPPCDPRCYEKYLKGTVFRVTAER